MRANPDVGSSAAATSPRTAEQNPANRGAALYGAATGRRVTVRDLAAAKAARREMADAHRL